MFVFPDVMDSLVLRESDLHNEAVAAINGYFYRPAHWSLQGRADPVSSLGGDVCKLLSRLAQLRLYSCQRSTVIFFASLHSAITSPGVVFWARAITAVCR